MHGEIFSVLFSFKIFNFFEKRLDSEKKVCIIIISTRAMRVLTLMTKEC